MKLYATIKAHKLQNGKNIIVEKGQGTNEYMGILLNDETGRNLVELYAEVRENDIYIKFMDFREEERIITFDLPKVKKQKDNTKYCYCDCDMSVPHIHDDNEIIGNKQKDDMPKCKNCKGDLSPSKTKGYTYQCVSCDEDFYEFEAQ